MKLAACVWVPNCPVSFLSAIYGKTVRTPPREKTLHFWLAFRDKKQNCWTQTTCVCKHFFFHVSLCFYIYRPSFRLIQIFVTHQVQKQLLVEVSSAKREICNRACL